MRASEPGDPELIERILARVRLFTDRDPDPVTKQPEPEPEPTPKENRQVAKRRRLRSC